MTTPKKVTGDSHQSKEVQVIDNIGMAAGDDTNTLNNISEIVGALKANKAYISFSTAMTTSQLLQVKLLYKQGEIKELASYGATFQIFCEGLGYKYETVRQHVSRLEFFAQDFMDKAEAMKIPVRMLNSIRKLSDSQRTKIIDAVINEDLKTTPAVKACISDLILETTTLREAANTAAISDKIELGRDLERAKNMQTTLRSQLEDEKTKVLSLKETVADLRAKDDPERQAKALAVISDSLERTIQAISKGGGNFSGDPIVQASLKRIDDLIATFNKLDVRNAD